MLKKLLILSLTATAASLVWRAAKMERHAARRAPSGASHEADLDSFTEEEKELLLDELAAQL